MTPEQKKNLAARRCLTEGRQRDAKRPKPPEALAERYAGALRSINRALGVESEKT